MNNIPDVLDHAEYRNQNHIRPRIFLLRGVIPVEKGDLKPVIHHLPEVVPDVLRRRPILGFVPHQYCDFPHDLPPLKQISYSTTK